MRIGELAGEVGVNTKTVRYYEHIGLLPDPERTASGYREYTEVDRERLTFVKTAQRLGLSLAEIAEILAFRDRGERPCRYVIEVLDRQVADLDRRIAELNALRTELIGLHARAGKLPELDGCYCTVIEHAATVPTATAERVGPPTPASA